MKQILLIVIILIVCKTGFAQSLNSDSVLIKHANSIEISTNDFSKLLPLITAPGKNDEEKLILVYYWVYNHIDFDTERFLKTGSLQPMNITETLKSGKGMCYEYNDFVDATCKYLKLTGYKIEGYVKFYGFTPGETFTDNNHIWYAVSIDGNWKMIDLLWACGTLSTKDNNFVFKKKLHKEYFMVNPEKFFDTHLPADPVFQFNANPLNISGFISKKEGADTTQRYSYINYADSINVMNKLDVRDRNVRSAVRAYAFNPENPNQLIVIYYNNAVELVNNSKATKAQLLKAKNYFIQSKSLIPKSKDANIKTLESVCEQGIISIDSRLKYIKS